MKILYTLALFCNLLLCAVVSASDYSMRGTTDKEVAIYKPGEKMIFTIRVFDGKTVITGKKIKWTRTGDDGKSETGEGIADEKGLKVTTSMAKSGFVRIRAHAFGADDKNLQGYYKIWENKQKRDIFFDGGACVNPEKLRSVDEPKDFDKFWEKTKAELDMVPINAELKKLTSKNKNVKVYAVKLDCVGGKPVTGYLGIPVNAKNKTLKAVVEFHGYGVPEHKASWFNSGQITFNVNAHGMELGRNSEYYKQLRKRLGSYCFNNEENGNRKKTYFYGMTLRVMRALQYVKSLPEWNGKDLESNGGSQGGMQGLWGAALDKEVTYCDIWSPWCCDLGGISLGRQRGFRPDFAKALNYFDPAFHAKRIKCRVRLVANYGDYTCPPSGVWIVYNNIKSKNKSIELRQGCTHGFKMEKYMKYIFTPKCIKDPGENK